MQRYPLRFAPVWIVLGLAVVVAVIVLSVAPSIEGPSFPHADKLAHFLMYFSAMLWFAGIYPPRRQLLVAGILALLGIALEGAQRYSAMRMGTWPDALANIAGLAAALLVARAGMGGWCVAIETQLARLRS